MTTDQVLLAVIGFGSAALGAVVGGIFVLVAARGQWKNDRQEAIRHASRESARRLLAALVPLEGAFATLLGGQGVDAVELTTIFNAFSGVTTTELPFITEDQVAGRVLAHVQLCWPLIRMAPTATPPRPVLEAVRRHADAVTEVLEAHIRGAPLPPYRPLPMDTTGRIDIQALIAWPGQGTS